MTDASGAAAASDSSIGTCAIACAGPFAWKPSRVTVTAPACTNCLCLASIQLCDTGGQVVERLTARLRSSIRSLTSSIPTQSLMMSSGICLSFLVAALILAWLI